MDTEKHVMKLRNLALSGALVAVWALGAVGCNENPVDDPGTVAAPSNVQAVSLGDPGDVGLMWTASSETGVTYTVSWQSSSSADAGSKPSITGTTTTIDNLKAEEYTFSVKAVKGSAESTVATVKWAPATRYTTEPGSSTTLRMYEFASSNGSGLIIDPAKGGPKNASVAQSSSTPAGSVQLAIYTQVEGNTAVQMADSFDIGPAFAFVEFRNADKFDNTAYISNKTFTPTSLDTWYSSSSIETLIDTDGNEAYFRLPNRVAGTTTGQGFFVRTGTAGNYHYARVFIKPDANGNFLRGSGNDQYIEVEVSYQPTAGLPYAKTAPGVAPTPTGLKARSGPRY
jgi:hypothetical protein